MCRFERRAAPRLKLERPLTFRCLGTRSDGECRSMSVNLSAAGIYFRTANPMSAGERMEILVEVPKEITGIQASYRRFTGRVAHVETHTGEGIVGVGVQLICYDSPGTEARSRLEDSVEIPTSNDQILRFNNQPT
jgi:PilZ domain